MLHIVVYIYKLEWVNFYHTQTIAKLYFHTGKAALNCISQGRNRNFTASTTLLEITHPVLASCSI
jgi:hypothetical protein